MPARESNPGRRGDSLALSPLDYWAPPNPNLHALIVSMQNTAAWSIITDNQVMGQNSENTVAKPYLRFFKMVLVKFSWLI